jgi:hypothetical protein
MLVVRVGDLVKDRRPPKAAALRAVLDKITNTNRVLSKRSRPFSGPSGGYQIGDHPGTDFLFAQRAGLQI